MVAAPALLDRVVDVGARDVTMAVWSCVMPFGIALALVAGPIFDGWRAIWWASAVACRRRCSSSPVVIVPSVALAQRPGARRPDARGRRAGAAPHPGAA